MKQFFLLSLFLCLANLASHAFAESLTVQTDRTEVPSNQSFTLFITYRGASDGQAPDLSEVKKLFEVSDINTRSNIRNINGRREVVLEWYATLFPRKEGKLLIPSLSVNGAQSKPLVVRVTEAARNRYVFVETEVDQGPVYTQQQIVLKYKVFYSANVRNAQVGEALQVADALQEQIKTENYTEMRDGVEYNVAEIAYLIYPQSSGVLNIPSVSWIFSYVDNRRMTTVREQSKEVMIRVKPQPESFPRGATWLPAKNVALSERWSKDPQSFKVGEPITRTITLDASGLMSSQLPKIFKETDSDAFKVYPDQPNLSDEPSKAGMQARRVESAAVIVNQNGTTTLPAMRIPWWNVDTDTLEYAEIPAREVQAIGQASRPYQQNSVKGSETPSDTNVSTELSLEHKAHLNLWRAIAIIASLLAIGFAVLWVRLAIRVRAQQRAASTDEQQTSKNLKLQQRHLHKACKSAKPDKIRASLLAWAAAYWPQQPPQTLQQMAARINNKKISSGLEALDQALYSQHATTFDALSLYKQLEDWQKSQTKAKTDKSQELASFYTNA